MEYEDDYEDYPQVGTTYEVKFVNSLPPCKVYYLSNTSRNLTRKLNEIKGNKELALDLEWSPDFAKGQQNDIAVLQFAGENGIAVVKMTDYDDIDELREYLRSNRFIMKGTCNDVRKIMLTFGISISMEDIENTRMKPHNVPLNLEKAMHSLAGMAPIREFKAKYITLSNWGDYYLDMDQFYYAAYDGFLTYQVYKLLLAKYPNDGPFMSNRIF